MIEAALLHELERVDHQYVFTHVDAFRAGNASVHIEVEHRAARIFRNELLFRVGQVRDPVPKCRVLQFAMAVGVADRAVKRVDREMFFHCFLSSLEEILPFCSDDHTGRRFGGAGADGRLLAFLHNQTHAAGAEGIEGIVVAHGRDDLARARNHVVERDPTLCRHGFPIDRQFNRDCFHVRIRCWLQSHIASMLNGEL